VLAIGTRSAVALRQHTASLPPNRCAAHREPFSYVEVEVGTSVSVSASVSDGASVSDSASASASVGASGVRSGAFSGSPLVPVLVFATPLTSAAQQPKLDIKAFIGVGGTTYVAMLETGRERGSGDVQSGFELLDQPQQCDDDVIQNRLPSGAAQPRVRLLKVLAQSQPIASRSSM